MKNLFVLCLLALPLAACDTPDKHGAEQGWVSLFDGKTLDGWTKAAENPDSVYVRDGAIVTAGPRCHLFYTGDESGGEFTNFEFKADVMTEPGSNSGIYFHTQYQETDWPKTGYEVQVNNSHKDPKRTGSLYAVVNVDEAPAKDNEWFTEHIIVQGKRIIIKVNDETVVDYTEPDDVDHADWPGRKLSRGTFALQAHDPNSTVLFKNIRVKLLP